MTTIDLPSAVATTPKPVAAWSHTLVLIAIFLSLALGGALLHGTAQPGLGQAHPRIAPLYLSLMVAEWGLLLYVWKGGLRRSGTTLRELIGGRWHNLTDVSRDVLLALGIWCIWTLVQVLVGRVFGAGHAASIQTLLPQGALEILLWIALSISAGICEEVTFRGYFQRQFTAYTHSQWLGLLLQALLFGVAHGYQGIASCARIVGYGLLFGLLARWRKSLRPGIMAHALTDILAGVFHI